MNSAKYDHEARIRSREEFLAQVPAPDEVFVAAARRAVLSAGLDAEIVDLLHPETIEKSRTPATAPGTSPAFPKF
jgi:hypothetical protein